MLRVLFEGSSTGSVEAIIYSGLDGCGYYSWNKSNQEPRNNDEQCYLAEMNVRY